MRQVEAAGVDHAALVAHSLAGITFPVLLPSSDPAVCDASSLWRAMSRVKGTSVLSNLSPPIRFFARMATDRLRLWLASILTSRL
ncbi:hypothetical protein [Mycobacterium avium]|uniref:hypothetical protein n=1 Tax=Mycobacterium avium TaxID=1764 RepID=UPI0007A07C78|nr:hypothetical protein [Mycobacterium avium]MDV3219524.1 hypothetical protein [Mycobacterium avium]